MRGSKTYLHTAIMGRASAVRFFCAVTILVFVRPILAEPLPADVVEKIRLSEEALMVSEADFRVTCAGNGHLHWEGTWGYEHKKGYLRGKQHVWLRETGQWFSYDEVYAYDGEKLRTLQLNERRVGGTVRQLNLELDAQLSPQTLLGWSIRGRGRYTLADLLAESKDLRVASASDTVGDYKCMVLEGTINQCLLNSLRTIPEHLKVWVAPDADYRPLRIEEYNSAGTLLRFVLHDLVLERIDGVWLPVSGYRTSYETKVVPLDGFTLDEVRGMNESDQARHVRLEAVPRADDAEANFIQVLQWRVLDDIDDKLFTIDFPPGAAVWDDFLQEGYKVGDGGKIEVTSELFSERPEKGDESPNLENRSREGSQAPPEPVQTEDCPGIHRRP